MSSLVIFFLLLLILLLLLTPLLPAATFLIICVTFLFIIELKLVVLTNLYLRQKFCDLDSPPTVAHLHPVIAEILVAIYLEVDNDLSE